MRYRQLPGTPLQVSEIGFGVWTVSTSWWGVKEESVRERLLKRALEMGINFFDTADTYGNGEGESVLTRFLKAQREKMVIATKFGYDFYHHTRQEGHEELPQDFSPKYIRFALEESLKRLATDRIDLYQLHNCRIDAIQRDDTFAELEKLKKEGKIRAFGVALGPAIAPRQAEEGRAAIEKRRVNTVQIIYNLLEQMLGEPVFAPARRLESGVLVRVPHASGLLDGTVTRETVFGKEDHRYHRVSSAERKRLWQEEGLKKVEQLGFLTEKTGRTLSQAALKFILREPSITSVFPNIYNEKLLEEFAAAPDTLDLTDTEFDRVQVLVAHNFGLAPASAG
ncbi:MAG: aldo/keto reductase [Candidatus Omnitrophica bacterium CG11_big_fil_rev_8_21_14_0_20_64_10]|nr:MAG: aldo/keto reductase [Candidatus Omnitrophica bacterium CG11_big_fil_rev_8_21_14_0_20_64_10]